jgi:hypothetical protein
MLCAVMVAVVAGAILKSLRVATGAGTVQQGGTTARVQRVLNGWSRWQAGHLMETR